MLFEKFVQEIDIQDTAIDVIIEIMYNNYTYPEKYSFLHESELTEYLYYCAKIVINKASRRWCVLVKTIVTTTYHIILKIKKNA